MKLVRQIFNFFLSFSKQPEFHSATILLRE